MKCQCRLLLLLLAVVGCSLASALNGSPVERFERTLKDCSGLYKDDCGGYYGDDTYGVVISEDGPSIWGSSYDLDAQEVKGTDAGSSNQSASQDTSGASISIPVVAAVAAATVAIFAVVATYRHFKDRRSESVAASSPSTSSA